MSDLQDLIHKTSMDCLAKGKQQEQERIIKLLEELKGPEIACCNDCRPYAERSANYLDAVIALIKGEK